MLAAQPALVLVVRLSVSHIASCELLHQMAKELGDEIGVGDIEDLKSNPTYLATV